ncbi:MAG TPA: PAS domain S-box protein [Baekduia sp.]|nr:PAS domain S-box protein [Baekduia sp.]
MDLTGKLRALDLEEVVGKLPVAVRVVAADGSDLYANARARHLAEREFGEPAPDDDGFDIYHLDGRRYDPATWPVVRSITTGEEVVDEEYFQLLADGTRVDIRCSSEPVYDAGAIVAVVLLMTDITEERAIARRLADHERLLESMQDGVVAVDAGMTITAWNAAAERLYGWSAAEALGRDATEVAGPMIGTGPCAAFRNQLTGQGQTRMQFSARRRDASTVDVEVIGTGIAGDDGELVGYLGIHRDVTELRRAHDELVAAQQRVEAVLESITDAFYGLDRDWCITYINDRALRFASQLAGAELPRADVLGRMPWEVLPALAGSALEDAYRRALHEQDAVVFDFHYPGGTQWFEVHVYPSPQGLAIYFRDISERKHAEAELARRQHQQALIADLGLRAVASDDLQELADEAVGLVARTLGIGHVGVMEVLPNGGGLVHRAGVGWGQGSVGTARAAGGPSSMAGYTIMTGEPVLSDDVRRDTRFALSPMMSDAGLVAGAAVVIAGHDHPFGVLGAFTRQPHVFSDGDVHFLQAVANLIASAAEGAAAAARMDEVRDAERSRIARDLHDGALSELSGAIDGIATDDRSGDVGQALARVGRQLRGAIYDLNLEDDEGRPFGRLLEELIEVQRGLAFPRTLTLTATEIPAGPLGRPGTQVLRMLREAVSNARRHADAQHIAVTVAAGNGSLEATVSDDGRGFDEATAPASTAGSYGLRGMRDRAAAENGWLDVTTRPGHGTRVRLGIPLPTADGQALRPARVLLVEDHTAVREAIANVLDREDDFDVVAQAGSLAEARGMLVGVDVAVIDLKLPDGFGSDLIAMLRAINRRAQAIVLTATLDRAAIAEAIESGAAAALHKSAPLTELADALRRLQAGETLLPLDDVVELIALARRRRQREHDDRAAMASVTPREREILQALAEGRDTNQIAEDLHITVRTQRNHVANILRKLGVHSQLQALVLALRYEVVEVHRDTV